MLPEISPEIAVGAAIAEVLVPGLSPTKYYDYVPAAGATSMVPLVSLGIISAVRQREQRCGRVWLVGLRLHVQSKEAGRVEVWQVLQRLRDLLDGVTLALADPYAADTPMREQRAGDMNDRLQAVSLAFLDFDLIVSSAT